ncbi:hypothetical protein Fcan01_11150 [Folsomia candida]|uniref:Uncharacterized protein n=1 Tax=Folsomia candida TaxID=158441 RepID=A0A226EBU9_FOLCA|nr:hypothetical protein Fcan01_11150 [Folsomia candida]
MNDFSKMYQPQLLFLALTASSLTLADDSVKRNAEPSSSTEAKFWSEIQSFSELQNCHFDIVTDLNPNLSTFPHFISSYTTITIDLINNFTSDDLREAIRLDVFKTRLHHGQMFCIFAYIRLQKQHQEYNSSQRATMTNIRNLVIYKISEDVRKDYFQSRIAYNERLIVIQELASFSTSQNSYLDSTYFTFHTAYNHGRKGTHPWFYEFMFYFVHTTDTDKLFFNCPVFEINKYAYTGTEVALSAQRSCTIYRHNIGTISTARGLLHHQDLAILRASVEPEDKYICRNQITLKREDVLAKVAFDLYCFKNITVVLVKRYVHDVINPALFTPKWLN